MQSHGCRVAAAVLVACALILPTALGAQEHAANPFSGFETLRLPNGLKVWYGHVPGATLTSMALIVPVGWDQDPRGGRETAHFLEHVLLSDRDGRAEAELVRELTGRGGAHNGVTTPDHTVYPLHIGTDEAAFGLRWLYGVVAPRVFADELVRRNREPVAIEVNAQRRSWAERLGLLYLSHPALRPAGFWRREFGLATAADEPIDRYRDLQSITADDLRHFYETHYSPAHMTLVIVTGAPRAVLEPVLDSTFSLLPWRPLPERLATAAPRRGESRRFAYTAGRSTRLRLLHRIPDLNGRDQLRLIFIEDLLRYRLMERLRRGSEKSVYSVHVTTEIRGPAALFRIAADMNPRQEAFARRVIDEELERIRTVAADTVAFYADRDALSRRLRVQNSAPATLAAWASTRFYRPDLQQAFPDLGEYYQHLGPDSIAAAAARLFTADNRIVRIERPLPLSPALLAMLAAVASLAAIRLYRRLALRTADMSTIRYVARIRPAPATRVLRTALALLAVVLLGRGLAALLHFTAEYWLLTSDSRALHALAATALLFTTTLAAFTLIGRMHHKVLVFDDAVRIKSPTYRSVILPLEEIEAARLVAHRRGLPLRHLLLGPAGEGVHVAMRDGGGYFLEVRRPLALLAVLTALLQPAPAPDDTPVPTTDSPGSADPRTAI